MTGVTKQRSERLDSLDALRGVAALAVAWFHIVQKSGGPAFHNELLNIVFDKSSAYGWLGVPAFFVLTGFIIPYATFRSPATAHNSVVFVKKRFTRLYPAFAATVVLAVFIAFAAVFVTGFEGDSPTYLTLRFLGSNLLLSTPFFGDPWLVPVFWSLLVEVQYYLFITIVLLFAARWRGRDLTVPLCLLAMSLAFIVPYNLHAITSWGTLFVIGHALYRHEAGIGRAWANVGLVVLAFALTGVVLGWLYLVPTALTIAVILWPPPLGRAFIFLGAISYSLYLTHYVIGVRAVRLLDRFAQNDFGYLATYLGATTLAIITAWLFYLAVEKPSLRWSARLRYRLS